jgi:asparagine synthase (glutamine-hydrolysing)
MTSTAQQHLLGAQDSARQHSPLFLVRLETLLATRRGPIPIATSERESGLTLVKGVGLMVSFDRRCVQHALDADGLTLSCGSPRWSDDESDDVVGALGQRLKNQGIRACEALRGRFSIVRVNFRSGELTLVTDRFAVHPICYATAGGLLVASDRADAVAQQTNSPVSLQAIHDYLYFHVVPAPGTAFESVRRVEPGRCVSLSATNSSEARTWTAEFGSSANVALPTLEEKFIALIESAVRRELDGSVVGTFLSGGTDSSTVAGMLCRVAGAGAPTYSIGFADEGYDEMSYARVAASHFGARHNEYYVTADDLLTFIPEVACHYDQPFGNSSAVPAYCCERLAASQGTTKLLAGDGGDELFGGNTRYAKQRVFEAYQAVPAAVRRIILEPALTGASPLRTLPLLRKVSSYIAQANVPMPERMETYNLLTRFGTSTVLAPGVLSRVDTSAPIKLQWSVYGDCADGNLVNRMLAYDWRFTLADTDLPKVTGTAGLAGVKAAFPLLDDDLVDFSLALPASMKVRGLTLRWFFKHALRDFLPVEVLRKKKHGFGLPIGPWLVRHDGLRRFARKSLDNLAERRVIRTDFTSDLFSTHLAEHPGYYGEMIWILMILEHWLASRAPDFSAPAS